MKRYMPIAAALLIAALLLPKGGIAQDVARRFEAGLVAAANLSQIDGDRHEGFRKPGFHTGIKVDAVLNERFRAGLAFLYTQQGARRGAFELINSNDDVESIHLNIVEVPLMLHLREWKLKASAGVSFAQIINYEVIDVTGAEVTADHPMDGLFFSLVFGGSFFFDEHWAMDFTWSRWLSSPYDEAAAQRNPQTLIPWRGRTISLGLSYWL